MRTTRWLGLGAAMLAAACGTTDPPARSPQAAPPRAAGTAPAPSREETAREAWRLMEQGHAARQSGDPHAESHFEAALKAWESIAGASATAVATFDDASTRPSADVKVIASTRDGTLAAQAWGNEIALYDAATWRLTGLLEGHTAQVTSLAFSGDGAWLFSGSTDGTVRRWDVRAAMPAGSANLLGALSDVALSPDGTTAVYRCGAHLCFWPASAPSPETRQIRPPDGCAVVRHWAAADTILAGEDGEDLCLLDAATGGKKAGVPFMSGFLSFAPQAPVFLASVLMGTSVRAEVWDSASGRRLRTLGLERPDGRGAIAIQGPPVLAPGGHRVAAPTSNREVTFWNADTGAVERQTSTRVPVGNPAYLADGTLVLPHLRGRGFDVLGPSHREPTEGLRMPMLADPEVSSPGPAHAVLLRTGARLVAWSLASGDALPWSWADRLPGPSGIRCSASDGSLLAIASSNVVTVRDVSDGRVVLERSVPPNRVVTAAGFLAGTPPALVVVSSEVTVTSRGSKASGAVDMTALGDASAQSTTRKLDPHLGAQLSRDGKVLATVVAGKGVRIQELPSLKGEKTIPVAGPWALSPDGSAIAWSGLPTGKRDGVESLRIVMTATGVERELTDVPSTRGPIGWRGDGGRVAYAWPRREGGVEVVAVDVGTGQVAWRCALPGSGGLTDFSWSGDGRLVFARDKTGRVHVLAGEDGSFQLSWALESDGQSWFATNASGRLEAGGPAGEAMMACKVGMRILPFEVCRHRFVRQGLVAEALRAR